jgi:uncharacterized ParB-like nuclease family protein
MEKANKYLVANVYIIVKIPLPHHRGNFGGCHSEKNMRRGKRKREECKRKRKKKESRGKLKLTV